ARRKQRPVLAAEGPARSARRKQRPVLAAEGPARSAPRKQRPVLAAEGPARSARRKQRPVLAAEGPARSVSAWPIPRAARIRRHGSAPGPWTVPGLPAGVDRLGTASLRAPSPA